VALRFFLALWIRHGSEELTPEPEPKYPVQEAGLDLKPRQSGQKATPGEKPPSITGRTTTGSTDSTADINYPENNRDQSPGEKPGSH
jgi:hypothetical protein